jgi:hypothetical protein
MGKYELTSLPTREPAVLRDFENILSKVKNEGCWTTERGGESVVIVFKQL